MSPPTIQPLAGKFAALTDSALALGIAVGAALVLHLFLFALLSRFAKLSHLASDGVVVKRLHQPLRWSFVAVAVSLVAESDPALSRVWLAVDRFIVPALLGWVAFALVKAFALVLESRAELSSDEFAARSRRTRVAILSRTATFVIVFVTVALILLGIPGVRNVGVTLIASASLVGLAVGAAAQPALKSVLAGMQMALTEPIRIDDFVVIDGESGRVEDIRMSYVVIRTSDERCLIVPTSKFLDTTFQNWTRVAGGISGSVVFPVKPGSAIGPIRAAYLEAIKAHKDWDGRTALLQVSESRVGSIELKLVMSAHDPAALAQLRLAVREEMLEWLRETMPEALCSGA